MRFQHDLEGQPCLSREPVLKSLVVGNLLASGAHFAHNAAFFDAYPEPPWIPGPWFVVLGWLLIAPVLVKGYYWHQEGKPRKALAAIVSYCSASLLVFGHYLYGPPSELDLLANFLIVVEGAAALVLLGYFLARARRASRSSAP